MTRRESYERIEEARVHRRSGGSARDPVLALQESALLRKPEAGEAAVLLFVAAIELSGKAAMTTDAALTRAAHICFQRAIEALRDAGPPLPPARPPSRLVYDEIPTGYFAVKGDPLTRQRINITASLAELGRTVEELRCRSWPAKSDEGRLKYSIAQQQRRQ